MTSRELELTSAPGHNKVAPPLRKADFDIRFGEGIDRSGELLELAVEHEIIDKKGSFYRFAGESLGQGAEKVREKIVNDDKLAEKIEKEVMKKIL